MKKTLKRFMRRIGHLIASNIPQMDHVMLLSGAQASLAVGHLKSLQTLGDAEFRVFSQWGEDGIIEWLVSRLPGIPRSFIEFGVQSYSESNTRYLMQHRNWRGLVMDNSAKEMKKLREGDLHWLYDLTVVTAFVDRDNINTLIQDNGFSGDLGVLSIDIDSTDYWVWDAVTMVNPWIVVAEYNAVFGDLLPLTIPYTPVFDRMAAHPSGLYWGASIGALTRVAQKKGYTLLGSNRAGCNAFYIRNDLLPVFKGAIADCSPVPSLYRESRTTGGGFSYIAGVGRREVISDATVVDVDSGQALKIGDTVELYSDRWKAIMGAK